MTAAYSASGEIATIQSRVSIVMTVYNDLRFLDEAVGSILHQELRDLEFIIVDDGTGQKAVFDALERRDPRIKIVVNPTNVGTAAAANRGIAAASADIIVRLDADDIAEPGRVRHLVAALDEDPELGLVGSWCTLIDEAGQPRGVERMPESDLEIRWTILFHNPFYHSTVAFRRICFEAAGRYKIDELISQDHYLWFQMLPLCRARNIAEPLVRYRMNSLGLTRVNSKNWRNRTHPIRESLWARLGLIYDLYDDDFARDLTQFVRGADIADIERRTPAYRAILSVLRSFLTARHPLARADDAKIARKLGRNVVARMLASPPPDLQSKLMICRLCWPIDRRAAMNAAISCLAGEARSAVKTARQWLVRQPRS